MSDFFRHIQVFVFNDILDGLHKPFTQSDGKRYVPFKDLASDRIVATTPVDRDTDDVVLAALIALREANIVVCQLQLIAGGVVIYEQPGCSELTDADFAEKVFSNPRVANACINMLAAIHVDRKGTHSTP